MIFVVDGESTQVGVRWADGGCLVSHPIDRAEVGPYPPPAKYPINVHLSGRDAFVMLDRRQTRVSWPSYDPTEIEDAGDGTTIRAPINGRVAKLFVTPGTVVEKGERVAVVEAMKMEHVLTAVVAGTIDKVPVTEGAQVTLGMMIATLVAGNGPA